MIFGSVCSGIEAASVAWEPLGWRCRFVAEIDPAACHVLQHRFGATRPRSMPEATVHTKHKDRKAMMAAARAVLKLDPTGSLINYGDFTTIPVGAGPIDVLVGGTPCQSFSVAGLRQGMADDRGNLALEFLRLGGRLRPDWVVWENVPGVLSSNRGRDFGAFLGGLVELGYGFAYRVLDAQYVRVDGFGRAVPQRRRRVFVVGYLGDWRRAAAVLFDRESLSGNPPPGREAGQVAPAVPARRSAGGGLGSDFDCDGGLIPVGSSASVPRTLTSHAGRFDGDSDTFVACTVPASNGGVSSGLHPVIPVAFSFDERNITSKANRTRVAPVLPCGTLHEQPHAIAFQERGRNGGRSLEYQQDVSYALRAIDGGGCGDWFRVAFGWKVRRLTPLECERLQGFPDGYTSVPYRGKPMADGPRYKMIGNSMAVNVMRWIGRRILEASTGVATNT